MYIYIYIKSANNKIKLKKKVIITHSIHSMVAM